jgi:hypothetical protein
MNHLRSVSAKRRKRMSEVKPIRTALIRKAGRCMICGASPKEPSRFGRELSELCCHEIANGPCRDKALDKPFAILVLCAYCNGQRVEDKAAWPQSRQLAVLGSKAPEDYDLSAFNYLVNPNAPNRITQEEVDSWREPCET